MIALISIIGFLGLHEIWSGMSRLNLKLRFRYKFSNVDRVPTSERSSRCDNADDDLDRYKIPLKVGIPIKWILNLKSDWFQRITQR